MGIIPLEGFRIKKDGNVNIKKLLLFSKEFNLSIINKIDIMKLIQDMINPQTKNNCKIFRSNKTRKFKL